MKEFLWILLGAILSTFSFIVFNIPSPRERFITDSLKKQKDSTVIIIGYGEVPDEVEHSVINSCGRNLRITYKEKKDYIDFVNGISSFRNK